MAGETDETINESPVAPGRERQDAPLPSVGTFMMPVVEETLNVAKEQRITGTVTVRKQVNEREVTVNEPLTASTIAVERVPMNREVEGSIPDRREGDTLVISVVEEVLVVTKRLMLREEIRLTRNTTIFHAPQTVTLTSEEVHVNRSSVGRESEGQADTEKGKGERDGPDRCSETLQVG